MLVWKTQTLNVNVASLRYRCLLPLRYLAKRNIPSKIYSGTDTVELTPQTKAIVFVKSFHPLDVATCDRAYQQGVPIILDLCDNIFVDGYGTDSDYVPAQNFWLMAKKATAIVTTGSAITAAVEKGLLSIVPSSTAPPPTIHSGRWPLVIAIPDGSESIDDIKFAFRFTRRKRMLQRINKILEIMRRGYKQSRRRAKFLFHSLKSGVSKQLQRYFELLSALPFSSSPLSPRAAQPHLTHSDSNALLHNTLDVNNLGLDAPLSRGNTEGYAPQKERKRQSVPFMPSPWSASTNLKTVLWFGNHGARADEAGYGNLGMLDVLSIAEALEAVNRSCPLRLVIVSNHRKKYEAHIAPLPFATEYRAWHPRKIYSYIASSDAVVVPNSGSVFSICKSANRAVLALSQGTPVIASRTPALDSLQGCIWLGDWESGLREYLLNPEVAQAHVKQAQTMIAQSLSGDAIAQKWIDLLKQIDVPLSTPL